MSLEKSLKSRISSLYLFPLSLFTLKGIPKWFWFTLGVVIFIFGILPRLGITLAINASPSIDSKVFLVIERIEPRCGELGAFYFNVPNNPYWKEGTRFVKRFVGCPNDLLEVRGRGFYVNGKLVGTARTQDSHGVPVSQFAWNGKIPDGYYFVLGDNPRSYDSRYWGFVKKEWIAGRAYPLF